MQAANIKTKDPASDTLSRVTGIEIQQLRFFVAANDYGSIRGAAEALSLRHSVISRSICQLEHLTGAVLLERTAGGVRPTIIGRAMLRIARLVLEQVATLVTTGKSAGLGECGRIAVGFCTSISIGNLRATLLEFKGRLPNVELAMVERSRSRLLTSLRNGTIDIFISTGGVSMNDSRVAPLWSERVLVAVPQDHALAKREVAYWTDLRHETVLLSYYDPGRQLEDLLISKFVAEEDRPRVDRHDVSRGILKSLISMGFGVGLVMESDVGATFAGLVYRDLRDGKGPSRIDFYAHWRNDNENPALQRFLQLLAERYPASTANDLEAT